MNTSKVYFTNLRTPPSSNLLDKMERLVKRAGIANIDFKNQFVAIKIHFGEPGNLAYIRTRAVAPTLSIIFKAPWKMGSIPCPPVATLSSPMA